MIDAYTIGITLALEDGVSDGILAIRRDLAALDIAVAESAARLLLLRTLARDLTVPNSPGHASGQVALVAPPTYRQQTAPPLTQTATQLQPSANAEPHDNNLPTVAIRQVTSPSSKDPVATVYVGKRDQRDARPTVPVPAQISAPITAPVPSAPAAPLPPALPVVQPVQAISPATPLVTARNEPAWPVDLAALGRSLSLAPVTPTPIVMHQPRRSNEERRSDEPAPSSPVDALTTPTLPSGRLPLAQRLPAVIPEPRSPTGSLHPPSQIMSQASRVDGKHSPVAPVAFASNVPSSPPAPRLAAAPIAQVERSPMVRAESQADSNKSTPLRIATNPDQTDRPVYAELHLDGAALGRWVTRHLERQVTRPQAGSTGFDPRMTPSWPGAPIGN